MNTQSLQALYVDELRDAYSAENQLLEVLPRMEEAASHERLQSTFRQHREQTQTHVRRLELILDTLGEKARGDLCRGMRGILDEIALYGTLRGYAKQLGRKEDARILQKTLDEEGNADLKV